MNKAVFLDRDGTINVEKEYLYKPEDFELIDGAAQAIAVINRLGYKVIVITNQSGIARGYFTEDDMGALHAHMRDTLSVKSAFIDAIYFCPHHPQAEIPRYRIDCDCRKPKAGLFRQAVLDFNIDASASWAVGDRIRDLAPGKALGMKQALVLTGYGKHENWLDADFTVKDLLAFANILE